jgi:hypothetical protein
MTLLFRGGGVVRFAGHPSSPSVPVFCALWGRWTSARKLRNITAGRLVAGFALGAETHVRRGREHMPVCRMWLGSVWAPFRTFWGAELRPSAHWTSALPIFPCAVGRALWVFTRAASDS